MPKYVVEGCTPLHGSIRLGGAKNVSYKLMIAALLGNEESRILNFSHISDVELVKDMINSLGARAYNAGERTLFVDPSEMDSWEIGPEYGEGSRASTMFLGPLLAKFGKARLPFPGGDNIGKRPLDRHLASLEALGVRFTVEENSLYAETDGLVGATFRFAKSTHTGTETMLMAAALAKGTTIIENAAEEPEIDDMIAFLNKMGARIRRRAHRVIEVEGVEKMGGAIHKIMPDQNEAVSYAVAAILTKGDIIVENARHQHMEAFLEKLEEIGGGYEVGDYGIRFFYKGPLRATDVTTAIHPGFKTDWQPLWAILLTQAEGTSVIHETVSQRRFQYAEALERMGVEVSFYNPEVADPEKTYQFNLEDDHPDDQHAMRITGPVELQAIEYKVPDLRAGATILLAALIAKGQSTIIDTASHVERGYESITERLNSMGAKILKEE
ncbi:UDP-N-acetylglucosamine 1-carboxyvinyltransferase [Candidatus Woesebacteria bacterium]|nr:UDP-N-acetylglucosamine 1-carboxyvinyltransferase [Candidatus Woesebacteria bacterium]MCD8527478.1 UDP-N-acetylglucosamine 1-carboxyvinyltransferase [Candidatus Woesebacteria bacterium]MCD8546220.1 UDP-N-acetylglucosamine 1-carboxyvinyltransferase [Candidatus Woesebacteria bacterium]